MDNQPLVSIGIPTYNRPEYLKKALDCAINQTYENLEIIVSDNCSKNPEVEKICREYSQNDSRVRYFRQEKNIGMAANGEFVLNTAKGKYYQWCMDDDWLSENYIEEGLKFLEANPDYSIAFGVMNFYNKDYSLDKECQQVSFEENGYLNRIKKYSKTAISSSLSFGLTTKDLVHKVYSGKSRMPEDWIFMVKILFEGKGKFIKNISYNALNNGCSKNLESLKEFFNMPELTQENFWETLAQTVSDAILSDDFFLERLDESKREKLALETHRALISNKKQSIESKKITVKKVLKYIIKNPLFLFKKDFYIKAKEIYREGK